jgi:sigma-B regulation protein RsbU (phosphoserine phosphatase)
VTGRDGVALPDGSVGEQLQRILLPTHLPLVAGWAFAALYQPAGEEILVGGDFYDWFKLPDGKILFLLGDVSGKGPQAGALAMSIRKAIKGIAWVTGDAFSALSVVEEALADEFGQSFATMCFFELTPGTGRIRMLLAGHPPPYLLDANGARELAAPSNCILGPRFCREWKSVGIEVAAGDVIVAFSDGLTDALRLDGTRFGDHALPALLAVLPRHLSSYEIAVAIETELRNTSTTLTDDLIVTVLQRDYVPLGD